MYNWNTKIQCVKGVGPAKAKILNGLKIKTVGDLLEHRPASYIFPGVTRIADLEPGANALIHGTVEDIYRKETRAPIVSAIISDGTGSVEAVWFNQIWLLAQIRPGMRIAVWGKVGFGRDTSLQFSGPKFSTFIGSTKDVAGGLYGKHTAIIRAALKEVLGKTEIPPGWLWRNRILQVPNWYPNLMLQSDVYKVLHGPADSDMLRTATKQLKSNELLLQQLALAVRRRQQAQQKAVVIVV
jgi:ATP-dependent DNA helicase RecG